GAADRARRAASGEMENGRSGRVVFQPRDEREAEAAAIWCRVLERPDVAATDDFFACGGHSLLAISLYGQLERTFGVRLALRDWLADASFGALVQQVRRAVAGREPAQRRQAA